MARRLPPLLLASVVAFSAPCVFARHAAAAPEAATGGEDGARERSRAAFRRGVDQLRAGDWARARQSFEVAYALYPHPSILLNLGVARLRTGDPVLAEQDLLRFLGEDAGASADELAGAREALAEARARVGTLRLVVSPGDARVLVDGEVAESGRVRCAAGRHVVAVSAAGHASVTREVDVRASEETPVEVALVRDLARAGPTAPEAGRSARTAIGLGAAGLAGVAFAGAGLSALRASALAEEYVDPASERFQDGGTRSEGITYRTAADVALGVGILASAAAVVLLVTDIGAPRPGPRATTAGRGIVLRW